MPCEEQGLMDLASGSNKLMTSHLQFLQSGAHKKLFASIWEIKRKGVAPTMYSSLQSLFFLWQANSQAWAISGTNTGWGGAGEAAVFFFQKDLKNKWITTPIHHRLYLATTFAARNGICTDPSGWKRSLPRGGSICCWCLVGGRPEKAFQALYSLLHRDGRLQTFWKEDLWKNR